MFHCEKIHYDQLERKISVEVQRADGKWQNIDSEYDSHNRRTTLSQSINESTSGFFIGTLFGLNENDNIWDAMNMGLKQAGIGLVTGSISGFEMGLHKIPFARSDTSSEVDGHVKPEKIVKDVMDSPLTSVCSKRWFSVK